MTEPDRGYSRPYDRVYALPAEPAEPAPPGPGEGAGALVPVRWAGFDLNPGHVDEWFTAVVTNVEGWYAGPPADGHDTERALTDGAAWGLKTLGAREVTISGAAAGPPAGLMSWRDRLAWLAALREPAELAVSEPQTGVTRTALVRAGTGALAHEFLGGSAAFRYQLTVTAADPLLYGDAWHEAVLANVSAAESGRPYGRLYRHPRDEEGPLNGWAYGLPDPPHSSAYLANAGSAPAPVYATWAGDMSASRLTDGTGSILVDALAAGALVGVDTATLAAEGPGGAPRGSLILPGSRPLTVPAFSTALWHLYATGSGTVTLAWRDTWA